MAILLIIFLIGLIFYVRMEWRNLIERRELEKRKIDQLLSDVQHTHKIFSSNNLNALLINEDSNYLYLVQREYRAEEFDLEDIPFGKILEVAIVEDDCVISIFPKNGLLHSLHDIEGSFNVEKVDSDEDEDVEDETVEKLSLKIVVDDLTNTLKEFVLIDNEEPKSKDSDSYTKVYESCEEWYQKLFIIIKRNEHEKVLVRSWR